MCITLSLNPVSLVTTDGAMCGPQHELTDSPKLV